MCINIVVIGNLYIQYKCTKWFVNELIKLKESFEANGHLQFENPQIITNTSSKSMFKVFLV